MLPDTQLHLNYAVTSPRHGNQRILRRLKHRQCRAVFRLHKTHFDLLAAFERIEIAVDEVGEHADAFVELDVANGKRRGRAAAGDAVGVNLAGALGLHPLEVLAEAVRADRARVVVHLAAILALFEHQFALAGGLEVGGVAGVQAGVAVFAFLIGSSHVCSFLLFTFHDDGAAAVPRAKRAAGAVGQCNVAVLDLHFRMRFAAKLAHGFDDFGHAAAVGRVVIAEAAAIGVPREFAHAGDQVTVGHEFSAFAFFAEAEVFDLHHHGDGEAVIDGGVFDIRGFDARHLKRARAGPGGTGVGQINITRHLVLGGFANTGDFNQRALQALGDFGPRHNHTAAAVADHAAIEAVQGVADHWRIQDFFHRHHVSQHGVRVVLRVVRRRDLDPCELFAGGAVLVHVTHGAHGVQIHRHRAVRQFKWRIGNACAAVAHLRAAAALRIRTPS